MSLPWPDPNTISMFDMIQILRDVVFDKIPTSRRHDPKYIGMKNAIRDRGDLIRASDISFFSLFDDFIFGYDWQNRKNSNLPITWHSPDLLRNFHDFWLKPDWKIADIGFFKIEYDQERYNYNISQTSPAYVKFSDLEIMLGEPLVPSPTRCDKRLWLKWLMQRIRIIDYLQLAISDTEHLNSVFSEGAYHWFKRNNEPPQKINDWPRGTGRTAYAVWDDVFNINFYQYFYIAGNELINLKSDIEDGGFSLHGKLNLEQWGLVTKYRDGQWFDGPFYDFGLSLQEDTFVRLGTAEVTPNPASHVMIRELTEPKEWRTPYEGMSHHEACGFTAGEVLSLSVYDFSGNATYYGGI